MTKIDYLQWREKIDQITPADHRIGSDVLLVECEGEGHIWNVDGLFRLDVTMGLIIKNGWTRMKIDMKEYFAQAPSVIIVLRDQFYESIESSEDIEANAIVLSDYFVTSLFPNFGLAHPVSSSIYKNPVVSLKDGGGVFDLYYSMMLSLASSTSVKRRLEAAKHLTLTMFYGYGFKTHELPENPECNTYRQEVIYSSFLDLLERYHKTERGLAFYADQLCITPKYLSQIVKCVTGHTALDCIEDYVVSEAKTLLSSTAFSIQEIAYELEFSSQSVFGKYFKRVTGMSPKQYRATFR
ncbi:MAG: helix-turn-helix domain-containing protein [Candidatus Cryptobacteroides sp.]